MNMDSGRTTLLVLLDLSAAFETLDHSSSIELLSGWYGISGRDLNWVRCHLSNRVQRVKLQNKLGEPFKMDYGVLQGSVLGPLLFTLYRLLYNARPVNEWITDEILSSKREKGSWEEYGEGIEQILIDHDSMHKCTSVTD